MRVRRQKAAARETTRQANRPQLVTLAYLHNNLYLSNWSVFKLFIHSGDGKIVCVLYDISKMKTIPHSLELVTGENELLMTCSRIVNIPSECNA